MSNCLWGHSGDRISGAEKKAHETVERLNKGGFQDRRRGGPILMESRRRDSA